MIIVVNGPPGSGKDTLADYLEAKLGYAHIRFKDELYNEAARVSGLPYSFVKLLATDRKLKERPNNNFTIAGHFVSPREFLIHTSENIIKPLKGSDYFGVKTADKAENFEKVVISDGGFEEEFKPLAKLDRHIMVIHLHREGCSFEGDSRDYLNYEFLGSLSVNAINLYNDSPTPKGFIEDSMEVLDSWI